MKAKKILKMLNYLPRWAWYLLSFFAAGPFGILGVYLVFHVLKKMEKEQAEAAQETARSQRTGSYADEDCVVTSDKDSVHPWEKAEPSSSRTEAQQKTEDFVFSDSSDVSDVIHAGHDAMRRIRAANDIIADEALSAQIDSIENSCAQILSILEQRPQLLTQLRSFLRYYLPTTLKLLDARAKLENTANTPKAREVRARISDAVGTIDKAFLKQVDALDAYRFIDLESEMDVLRDMLRADGLIDEEKDIDDPFAQVLG